jgi:rhodanese-related sulfurtransferase
MIQNLFLSIFISVAAVVFSQQSNEEAISIQQFKDEMKSDTNLVILDVRNPEELKGPLGQINGVINIPVQNLEQKIHELDRYKNKHLAVICRTGHRSGIATNYLREKGFNAVNVLGGMVAYRASEKNN